MVLYTTHLFHWGAETLLDFKVGMANFSVISSRPTSGYCITAASC